MLRANNFNYVLKHLGYKQINSRIGAHPMRATQSKLRDWTWNELKKNILIVIPVVLFSLPILMR